MKCGYYSSHKLVAVETDQGKETYLPSKAQL